MNKHQRILVAIALVVAAIWSHFSVIGWGWQRASAQSRSIVAVVVRDATQTLKPGVTHEDYERALKADPNHALHLGNYALFKGFRSGGDGDHIPPHNGLQRKLRDFTNMFIIVDKQNPDRSHDHPVPTGRSNAE